MKTTDHFLVRFLFLAQTADVVRRRGEKYRGEVVQEHKNSVRNLGDANLHEKEQQRM